MSNFPISTINAVNYRLHARSAVMLNTLEGSLPRIMSWWFVVGLLSSAVRIAVSPIHGAPGFDTLLPYALLVGAPLLSMALALHWFRGGDSMNQPSTRLAAIGRWRVVDANEAQAHPLYGTTGIMVSLLIGILLNVPVRALEYLAAMPAFVGDVPRWLSVLRFGLTLDVVLLSSLYTIAFVAALRRVPLFPRMLAAVWAIDLTMQLGIAGAVAGTDGLPAEVRNALRTLLDGNVKKVLISIGLWLPYLLLSKRVNVTFRHRVEA